jgi:hypothetical protein
MFQFFRKKYLFVKALHNKMSPKIVAEKGILGIIESLSVCFATQGHYCRAQEFNNFEILQEINLLRT